MDQEQNEVTPLISSKSKPQENIERSKCKYNKNSKGYLKGYCINISQIINNL